MKTILRRTLYALSVMTVTAVLTACGAGSSVVDPFKPSRVIGLGDAYNDTDDAANDAATGTATAPIFTVRGTTGVETVVEQVATLFGVASSNVHSYANSGAGISDLTAQITAVGTFNASDLVVITAGTAEIKAAYPVTFDATTANTAAENAAVTLVDQVKELLRLGARHILIMQPLEFSQTPFARNSSARYPLNTQNSPTVAFNAKVAGDLQTYVAQQGYTGNPVIFGGMGLSSTFNNYVSGTAVSVFANSRDPKCSTGPTDVDGCDGLTDDNYLFADGINLTPAGNRWVGQSLYNATAQGWR